MPVIVEAPHHALGHARRTARIQEKHVITGALDGERTAIPRRTQRFVVEGPLDARSAVVADLDPDRDLGQPILQRGHVDGEFAAIDHNLGVRVVEDVVELFVDVSVVDVDVREATLECRRQRFGVGGVIAEIERDLVAGFGAVRMQGARKAIRAFRELGPGHHAIAMDERRLVARHCIRYGVQNVAVVPTALDRHHVPLPHHLLSAHT